MNMDLLGGIMSEMDKEKANDNSQSTSTPSASQQSFGRIPKKSQAAAPTPANEEPTSSRPPAVFNKRPLPGNDEHGYNPEIKKEKTMDTFKTIKCVDIQTNQYEVHLNRMPEVVERFHLDIFATTVKGKTTQINGETVTHGELAKQYRLWGLWNVWKLAIKISPHLFDNEIKYYDGVYDCGSSVYFRAGVYKGQGEESVVLNKKDFEQSTWSPISKLSKSDIDCITVVFVRNKGSGHVYTRGVDSLRSENSAELIRFLEVLTSQITNGRDYFQFGNSTFTRSSDKFRGETDRNCQIDAEGKEIKTGFEKTMRLIADKDGHPKVVMTIDTRRSPFYQENTILEILKVIYNAGRGNSGGGGGRGGHGGRGGGGYGRDRGTSYGRGDQRGYDGGRRDDRGHSYGRGDDRGRRDESRSGQDGQNGDAEIMDIIDTIRRDGENKTNKKLNELRSVAVCPVHLPTTKLNLFFIHGFVYTSAKDFKFPRDGDDSSEISMYEYFMDKYKIKLKYPDLPLAAQKRGNGVICYPLELLNVERGQRVKQHNITPKIQQEMTGKLSLLPLQHIEKAQDVLNNHLRINDNKFLRSFGVSVDREPTKLTAKILPAPVIHFAKNATDHPNTGTNTRPNINSRNVKFAKSAQLKEIWIINFDDALYRESQGRLCDAINQACRSQNISISKRPEDWQIISCNECDHQKLEKIMNDAKERQVSLLFAVTKEQRPDVHDVFKLYESQIGIQTQHVSMRTANMLMAPNGRQTMENVIRKLNLKCGGLNFSITVPRTVESRSICDNERGIQKMLFDNTLLIGFELAHAGATCLFDKQNNIACGEPSVVGYSYSCGDPCGLGGYSYLQKPREHSIMYLPKHMSMILSNYLSVNKTLPEKVVIFRSGVGEGDFEKVAREVEQMKSVFENDGKLKGKPVPKFLMVVVSKMSHMRIYPKHITGGKSFEQNVPSGTCVAGGITAYGRDEFYLISQSALIGTIRPARYTIIVNEPNWSLNEVSHLTYFLAFGHQVSYQPPGVPNILYAAENMAKRGRNNFKAHQKLERIEGGIGNRNEGIEDNENGTMMDDLSSQLNKCAINCKNFWA